MVTAMPGNAVAQSHPMPAFNVVSEDLSEQRRSVFVRLERRLDEAELLRMGEAIKARAKRAFARTQVNYFLPGMPLNQVSWANVLFSNDAKVQVQGLRREDEDLFMAEHRADRRPMLGSWLTSPPAASGRLTIYSDQGRIFAEWRLRGGQKTVDELQDGIAKTGRRFDVTGGGYYVLTRSGELEIWDKTTLIATAERIRPEHLALPLAVALGPKPATPAITTTPTARQPLAATGVAPGMVASPVQPEPKVAADVPAAAPAGPTVAVAVPPETAGPERTAELAPEPAGPKAKSKKQAKGKSRNTAPAAVQKAEKRSRTPTPGEQIAAKMAGQY